MQISKWEQVGPEKVMESFMNLNNPIIEMDYYDVAKELKDAIHIYYRIVRGDKGIGELLEKVVPPFIQQDTRVKLYLCIRGNDLSLMECTEALDKLEDQGYELFFSCDEDPAIKGTVVEQFFIYQDMIHGEDFLVGKYVEWLKTQEKYLMELFPEAYEKEKSPAEKYVYILYDYIFLHELRINDNPYGLEILYANAESWGACRQDQPPEASEDFMFITEEIKRVRIITYAKL